MHVVVVGGGIIGLSSAYQLSQRGVDVTVVERASLGAGATDRAAGGIRAQFSTRVSIELSKHSIEIWETFGEDFGVDIGYNRPGYLYLARNAETAEQVRNAVDIHNEHGVDSEFLNTQRLAELFPAIHASEYAAASYCPTDGFADPHLALQGFSHAAREQGVTFRVGEAVTDIRTGTEGVTGVQTTDGRLDADYVVNAAGGWGHRVAAMAGQSLRIHPKRRRAAVVAPDPPVPDRIPFTTDLDTDLYFRPDGDGEALIGGHFSPADPDVDPDHYREDVELDWVTDAIERAADVAEYFGDTTTFREGWAGIYALTPDHHPIIEESIPGFVNAVGFSGHGFMQSPAAGIAVSELIVDGAASLVDISPLTADRFGTDRELGEALPSA